MITYVDTSVLLKLLVDDEAGSDAAQRLWLDSQYVVCADIGYVEARAALAAAARAGRIGSEGHAIARAELEGLWRQVDRVLVNSALMIAAADLAESEGLRGYDAVHLAAAFAANATVMATADKQLLAAAARNGLDTANPASASTEADR